MQKQILTCNHNNTVIHMINLHKIPCLYILNGLLLPIFTPLDLIILDDYETLREHFYMIILPNWGRGGNLLHKIGSA